MKPFKAQILKGCEDKIKRTELTELVGNLTHCLTASAYILYFIAGSIAVCSSHDAPRGLICTPGSGKVSRPSK